MLRFTSSSIGEIVAQNYHGGKLRFPTSLFGCPVREKAISAVRTTDGGGYWILLTKGTVYAYGNAASLGGPVASVDGADPATTIFTTSDGGGYWVASANGSVFTYGDAPYEGGANSLHLNGAIIAGTGW